MSSSLDFLGESGCSAEASDANSPSGCSFVRQLRGLEEDLWREQDVAVPSVPLAFIRVKLLGVCCISIVFLVAAAH